MRTPGLRRDRHAFLPVARRWLAAAALLALAGCASFTTRDYFQDHLHAPPGTSERACAEFFAGLDQAVLRHQVGDADAARIDGFPYLRTDRLLASYAADPLDAPGFETWLDRLQEAGVAGHSFELTNLPEAERAQLKAATAQFPALTTREIADGCTRILRKVDFADQEARQAVLTGAQAPPLYRTWQRVVGLYPLSSIAFALGARQLRRETQATFDRDLTALPVRGRLVRYAPPSAAPISARQVAAWFGLQRAGDGPQRLSSLDQAKLNAVFAHYAPVFEIDTVSDEDRIGALRWQEREVLATDIAVPRAYRYLSYARFGGSLLPQLNYTVWFPAREREGAFDLLGGHLDGITWRVTLGTDGNVLIADAVHNCGCYHLFFPSSRLELVEQPATLEETAFAPQVLPALPERARFLVRVAHHTHFIERVLVARSAETPAEVIRYAAADYDVLRSLPLSGGGLRSAFGADGIVPGTQRAERYLYWPMGVPDTGAMRQRGHHATAFVGRRYFDDPFLLEHSFAPVP